MADLIVTVEEVQSSRRKRHLRITKWAIFTVIFGVAPLFASWAVSDAPFSRGTIIGHGELFLIAAVLTGDAFGRVWNENATKDLWGTVCLGALGLILAYSALEFGNSSKDLLNGRSITDSHIEASIADFVASIISAFAAVRLEE
jgi:hypothetical protein